MRRWHLALLGVLCASVLGAGLSGQALADGGGQRLTAQQRTVLHGIATDTWRFYGADVDPVTHLPLDNLGPGAMRGAYTSAANIGVYLWAVVAARDLHLIDTATAQRMASQTLTEVATLKRYDGFLYQWYDTTNGNVLLNPNQGDCAATSSTGDNCSFVSAVDNGWYASGLIEVRQALPGVRDLASRLLSDMDFSIFYDNRAQTDCNTNASLPGNQPTGQQYGGFYVGQGPASYHNGALYSDPRISMYIGMGLHQMPGDVWWRTWRTLPPQRCPTDPDFSWQGQWPVPGYWQTITDPAEPQAVPGVGGPLRIPRHLDHVHPDVRRRHVRRADGEPGRSRDGVGDPQLRPCRPTLGPGPGALRHPGAARSGLGDVAVQHP